MLPYRTSTQEFSCMTSLRTVSQGQCQLTLCQGQDLPQQQVLLQPGQRHHSKLHQHRQTTHPQSKVYHLSTASRPPRRWRATRSTAAGSPYIPPVTRAAARTETRLRIQADQEVIALKEDPMVAAQEFAGQEAAAKKKIKSCAVCLQENISVTRPIYLVSCGHGDKYKEYAQKVSTKDCHLSIV